MTPPWNVIWFGNYLSPLYLTNLRILRNSVLNLFCLIYHDSMASSHVPKACVRVLRSTRSSAHLPQTLTTTCCKRAIHYDRTLKPLLFARSVSRPSLSDPVTLLARKTRMQRVRTLFIQTENTPNADVSNPSQNP